MKRYTIRIHFDLATLNLLYKPLWCGCTYVYGEGDTLTFDDADGHNHRFHGRGLSWIVEEEL